MARAHKHQRGVSGAFFVRQLMQQLLHMLQA
jgi:hypothetical protein